METRDRGEVLDDRTENDAAAAVPQNHSPIPAREDTDRLVDPAHAAPPTGTKICVIGSGFVGLLTAAGLTQSGHTVVCVEKDREKAAKLAGGALPPFGSDFAGLVHANRERGRLSFTTDLAGSLTGRDVIIITVGTPAGDGGEVDLSAFDEVIATLAGHLHEHQIVVIKSTVPVGTARRTAERLRAAGGSSGAAPVVSCPEFLRGSTAVRDFFHPERIVVGGSDPEAVERIVQLYRVGVSGSVPIIVTGNETAELIKYASNVYLATRLSFVNELSAVCDALNVAVGDVTTAMGLDRRIGSKYLDVGPGFGGSCLPKDLDAYIAMAGHLNVRLDIAPAVRTANQHQLERTVEKVRAIVGGTLEGKRIGALGLAYKAHTHDVRSSPALTIIRALLAGGARVSAYDPAADLATHELAPQFSICTTPLEAAERADALVILTEWPEFRELDWDNLRRRMSAAKIVDARNLLSPEIMRQHGYEYVGLGQR